MGYAQTHEPCQHAEHDTLSEELLDDATAPRPQAQPDSHFPPPLPGPNQEEVCHVHAGDEKEEPHHHHHQRTHPHLGIPEHGMDACSVLGHQGRAQLLLVVPGELLTESKKVGVQQLASPLDGLPLPQSTHCRQHVVTPGLEPIGSRHHFPLHHDGNVDGYVGEAHRPLEALGSDTHDLEGVPVQEKRRSHHVGVTAEPG